MNDSRWARVMELFEGALEHSVLAREAWLREQCGEDHALLAEVQGLLEAQSGTPTGFLDPPALDRSEIPPGFRIGEFEIIEELGRGGMGVVYRARQPSLDRVVALKVLVQSLTTTTTEVERFHREARAAAKMTHPNIVPILLDGQHESVHWFAMECVEGHNLQIELDSRRRPRPDVEPFLPPKGSERHVVGVARLIAAVADALQHAHGHGVVHRDIKPSNLLLNSDLHVKVVDFGIARDQSFGTLTHSQQMIGSLYYMSPEQAKVTACPVDHRTDVYSLGVVLYELLTSERPIRGETSHEVMVRLRQDEPPPVRSLNSRVPHDLALICATAMAKEPADRYATAAEFRDDLHRFLGHEAIRARSPSLWRVAARRLHRHRVLLRTTGVGVAMLLSGLWWSDHSVRAHALDAALAPLVELSDDATWLDRPVDELIDSRAQVARILEANVLSDDHRKLLTGLQRRFRETEAQWKTSGTERVKAGLEGAETGDEVIGYERIVRGLCELQNSTLLSGSSQSLVDPQVFAPRLSLSIVDDRGAPVRGTVRLQVLDEITAQPGEPTVLGSAPLTDTALPSGNLRLSVEVPGQPLHEFTRLAPAGARIVIAVELDSDRRLGTDRLGPDMVRLEGGPLLVNDNSYLSPLEDRPVFVAPFELDTTEVSIGDYRAFLDAHPEVEAPFYLPWVEPGSDLESRPAVYLSWSEARAYAEWRGKRLPTHAEWIWAARGEEFRDWPWPGKQPYLGNTHGSAPTVTMDRRELWECFLVNAAPVRSHAEAATESGLYHLFGNVWEWTESHVAERDEAGHWHPRYHVRWLVGSAWDAFDAEMLPSQNESAGTEPSHRWIQRGFRCARSILQ